MSVHQLARYYRKETGLTLRECVALAVEACDPYPHRAFWAS